MEANELRIGNYYKAAIDFTGSASATMHFNESREFILTEKKLLCLLQLNFVYYIQPIPLTEEWLLKFGFEKKSDTEAGIYYEYKTMLVFIGTGKWIVNGLLSKQYVHQLQNLYFALSDEELEIKE